MLRNGETTEEAVNTAKHYLYALKSIAAAKSGKLTQEVIEEDCVGSYNVLLKQLAQIGGLSKTSQEHTHHRKARDSRAAKKETAFISEGGGDSPKSGEETTLAQSAGVIPIIAARFLRRFLALHGKTFNRSKTSTLLRSLQRAIVGKEIRKTDRNAELIEQMQSVLIRMLDVVRGRATVEFDAKTLAVL